MVEPNRPIEIRSVCLACAIVLDHAATMTADDLRGLEAVHVASAWQLDDELHALVTYDDRMRVAARALGIPTARPT
jgi:hypothetical protein